MIRTLVTGTAALVAMTAAAAAAESTAHTTRIVTEPTGGARVSIEQGVRVFRPLPSEQRVIVNPGGKADVRVYSYDGPVHHHDDRD